MIDHEYYSKIARGCLNFTDLKGSAKLSKARYVFTCEVLLERFVSDCLSPIWCLQNNIHSVGYFLPTYHEYIVYGALYGAVLHIQGEAVVIVQTETDAHVSYIDILRKPDGGYDYYSYTCDLPLTAIRKDIAHGLSNVRRDKKIQDEIDELTR